MWGIIKRIKKCQLKQKLKYLYKKAYKFYYETEKIKDESPIDFHPIFKEMQRRKYAARYAREEISKIKDSEKLVNIIYTKVRRRDKTK